VVREEQAEHLAQYEQTEVELGHVATVVGEAAVATGVPPGNSGLGERAPC
jgi:hypothetical protein